MGLIRLGVWTVLIGGLIYLFKSGKLAANSFGYAITGYGTPGISGTTIQLPVIVKFNNPSPIAINIDNVNAQIYIDKNGWVNVANINQALSIPAGTNSQTIKANIDLSKLFGGNIFNTLSLIANAVQQQVLNVRTDIAATYSGVTFPAQSFTSQISVG